MSISSTGTLTPEGRVLAKPLYDFETGRKLLNYDIYYHQYVYKRIKDFKLRSEERKLKALNDMYDRLRLYSRSKTF
ncbi:hypothetical protein SNEBB_004612 [Seison nebaliae]|nr:hypothetical protein SNEBB_004612 [Seison nebaliae]